MSRHMFTPTSEAAFGKGGILHLGFRKTGWHIAVLTLEQMCRLFYIKRATDSTTDTQINIQCQLRCETPEKEMLLQVPECLRLQHTTDTGLMESTKPMEDQVFNEGGGNPVDGTIKGCYKQMS